MFTVYLAIGANTHNPKQNVLNAIALIRENQEVRSCLSSGLFKTEAVSSKPQPDFINAAVCIQTDLLPDELYALTSSIEKTLGKKEKPKEAPRPIDIDVLFYQEKLQPKSQSITLPHPLWTKRLFVLYPLQELPLEASLRREIEQLILKLEKETPKRCEKYLYPL